MLSSYALYRPCSAFKLLVEPFNGIRGSQGKELVSKYHVQEHASC